MENELYRLTAREAVRALAERNITPSELVDAAYARIADVEPAINALPTLCPERARAHARELERNGTGTSMLGGLPISVKDLTDVAGVRTTYGSPIYADHVPERSDILVERLESNGAIVIAKSNTPEFGAGANTFNPVFGITRNPWNTALTTAGSSGGAAASLAAGEVWLATGTDLGGSLRTPASFCGVVGLRPSLGRVAHGPNVLPFDSLSVPGPMARNVGDLALMLDAMCGASPLDPLSHAAPETPFVSAALRPTLPKRIAFSADLGGIMPLDPEVRDACNAAARRFAALGADVVDAAPDLKDARGIFQILRAAKFASLHEPLLEKHRDKLKPDVIWNIEAGLALSSSAIGKAERARGALFARTMEFFATYDLLVCPTAMVPPFPVETRFITEVDGTTFDNYVEWLIPTFALTLTSCPVISIPCGFTRDGRPIGIQIVAPPFSEALLLAAAAAFEADAGFASHVPIDPRVAQATPG